MSSLRPFLQTVELFPFLVYICVCVCVSIARNSPSKALLCLLSTVAHGCQRTVAGWCSVIAVEDIFLPPLPPPPDHPKQIEKSLIYRS
jgi:hypothetical protein